MTTGFAICLAILSIGSCFACYRLGRESMRQDIRDFQERRRRWEDAQREDWHGSKEYPVLRVFYFLRAARKKRKLPPHPHGKPE